MKYFVIHFSFFIGALSLNISSNEKLRCLYRIAYHTSRSLFSTCLSLFPSSFLLSFPSHPLLSLHLPHPLTPPLTTRRWGGYLWGCVRWEPGAVSMSSIVWRRGCCLQSVSRSRPFRRPSRSKARPPPVRPPSILYLEPTPHAFLQFTFLGN